MGCRQMAQLLSISFLVAWYTTFFGNITIANEMDGVCEKGHLLCPNSSDICIPQHNFCNFKPDCPNDTDENPVHCDDHYKSLYYDRMYAKNPKALNDDLDETCKAFVNLIKKLSYQGQCQCRHRDLYCKNLKLSKIPNINPEHEIDILDLSGNTFNILSEELFESIPNNVQRIVMKHCGIREIKPSSFFNLTLLEELHLDNNNLMSLINCSFGKTNFLSVLVLSYNNIVEIRKEFFSNLTELEMLDLSYNNLATIDGKVFEDLERLTELYLRGNKLVSISKFSFPNLPVSVLSLIENKIERLEVGCFGQLQELTSLDLAHNHLKVLEKGTFQNLSNLMSLTLNGNLLENFHVGVFADVTNLISLNLEGNKYNMLTKELFKPLTKLKHIYLRRFEMCNAAPSVRDCNPKDDGISSNEHLLHNPVLRASVWIMAAVGCIGNIMVLLGRLLAKTNNAVHSLYIKNLALSDFLMSTYLFTIAGADKKYRGAYLEHEEAWRHSNTCNACGFLSTLSSVSSVFILSLVTWDRFISVTKPLARKQASAKTAIVQLLILWGIAFSISFLPISGIGETYFKDFYNNNGVCLPLHIHDPFQQGWEYSTVMFVVINSIALVYISYAYARMVHEIKTSGLACRSTQQSKDRDKVAKRFGVIVLTDCLCWVPVIIVKIAALFGAHISKYLYAWIAIFILPINSALNPVLYTLTTTLFQKQIRKTFGFCIRKQKRRDHPSGYDSASSLSLGLFPIGSGNKRLNYRGTQTSLVTSKDSSCKKPTAV